MNPPELQNPKMNSLDLSRPNQQKKSENPSTKESPEREKYKLKINNN